MFESQRWIIVLTLFFAAHCDRCGIEPRSTSTPTAKSITDRLFEAIEADQPHEALEQARVLLEKFPDSPEAREAATLISDIEAMEREARKDQTLPPPVEPDSVGGWSYFRDTDEMTGEILAGASIQSTSMMRLDFPYEGLQRATLQVGSFRGFPVAVISIERGQILCSSHEECQVRIRFDSNTVETWAAIAPSNGRTTSIALKSSGLFIQRLATAKSIRIVLELYRTGGKVQHFDVSNFNYDRCLSGI